MPHSIFRLNLSVLLATSLLVPAAVHAQAPAASPNPPAAAAAEAPSAPAATDSFRDALAAAYANNPRLKAEREALQAVDEQVAVALSGFRPNASAEYEKGRQRIATAGTRWQYGDTETRQLVVEQPIFNGGTTFAEYKAAKARVEAGQAQLLGVEQSVLLEAARAYSDVVQQQSVLELSRNNVEVLRKQLDATQARFDVGDVTRTDVAQSDARLSRAQSDLRQAEADLKTAQANFVRVTGVQPQFLVAPAELPPLPATLPETVELAERANPEVMQAYFLAKAADQTVNARIGDILPDVSVRGTMARNEGLLFGGGVRQFDSDALTLNVSIPLYQSGSEYARVREARNREQEARFQTGVARNDAIEQAVSAFEDYQAALAVIESNQSSVRAAEVALEGVRQESDFGVRTILDVLDAEQELFLNRVNLVRAHRNRVVSAFELLAATGQLTASRLDLPVTVYDPDQHYKSVRWLPIGF